MKEEILRETPIKEYRVGSKTVFVKKEDMCCVDESAPKTSKMRGLASVIEDKDPGLNRRVLLAPMRL